MNTEWLYGMKTVGWAWRGAEQDVVCRTDFSLGQSHRGRELEVTNRTEVMIMWEV